MAEQNQTKPKFRTSIGGQALIEGILMRGPEKQAIVVRSKEGLVEKVEELKLIRDRYPILGLPVLRGAVTFVDSMVRGVKALMYSADFFPEEEGEPSKLDLWLEKKLGSEKLQKLVVALAVVLSLGLTIGLFMILPTFLAGLLGRFIPNVVVHNLVESVIKLLIFFGYLLLCSKQKDIQRVFQYHGAEHKTIFCYEAGLPLTVENCRIQPRHHPRCGTSFLFVVGVTYEFNRYVGGHDNPVTNALAKPGLWLQNFTTNEPDDSMLEVAIRAMELVIPEQKGKDEW